jgi:hypothetical protein
VLLPLDPDEGIVEPKPRITRVQVAAVLATVVCVTMLAAYRYVGPSSLWNPASRKPSTNPGETQQVDNIPQTLDLPSDLVLPAPKPENGSNSRDQPESLTPGHFADTSSKSRETPQRTDRVSEPAASLVKPADSDSLIAIETPNRRIDTQPQKSTERQAKRVITPPSTTKEEATLLQLRRTKETIARLAALVKNGDFAKAVNTAITFRHGNPGLAKSNGNEYRELLKLQRIATMRYFTVRNSSVRRPAYDTGDLDVAVIDHDLMTSYLQAAMPTFALEYYRNAEQGYDRALSAARQRERTASGSSSAKRDVQQITENLGLLYASWAENKPDVTVLRKADAAFFDSERLLDYAEDPASAKRRVMDGKAIVERTRRRLP